MAAGPYRRLRVRADRLMARILVIDDDGGVRESMTRMLRGAGYTVQSAPSGEEGFDLARNDTFDVILSDMRMPGLSGLDVLRKLRDVHVDASFIIMTGFGTVDTAVEAMKLGAVDFVQKPFFRDELLMRVRDVENVTVVIATHDATIHEVADRTYHIIDGRIAQIETYEDATVRVA